MLDVFLVPQLMSVLSAAAMPPELSESLESQTSETLISPAPPKIRSLHIYSREKQPASSWHMHNEKVC